jgi:methylmalonyl-CoA mutase
MQKLFSEFTGVTNDQWKDQIIKDLKGIDFQTLTWHTSNGIDVRPFYSNADLPKVTEPLFNHIGWDACEHIYVTNESSANKQALSALQKGATGLVFVIHKKIETAQLLKDISVEHIYTQFVISNDALHVLNDLRSFYSVKNKYDGKIKCVVILDPIGLFGYYGEWHDSQEKDLAAIKDLIHIPVNASLYQEAGANQVNELAFAVAHVNEYFNYLNNSSALNNKIIHVTFSIGGDFFMEIAKLRAFRKLIDLLQATYQTSFELHIHCQTSELNKSEKDAYTNLLRSTTEAMSAVIGGTNSLSVMAYDHSFNDASDFSSRMSINQQHILRDESYLNKVADMASGSYYIESLTEQLAEKAWDAFKDIEANGGLIACLNSGKIQNTITENFDALAAQYKENKLVLIGVNKYPNASETKQTTRKRTENTKGKNIDRILPKQLSDLF